LAEAMFRADCEADGVAAEDRDWLWADDSEPVVAEIYARKARAAWDAVAEGLGLRGRHITDHEIGYFDEDGNAILQYGGTLHQCEDVLARHPNWFHPDAKILVKQWMFLQSSPEGEWRTVGEPQP
jgi:hypothetical protein